MCVAGLCGEDVWNCCRCEEGECRHGVCMRCQANRRFVCLDRKDWIRFVFDLMCCNLVWIGSKGRIRSSFLL